MAQLHMEPLHAARAQGVHRHGHHLQVRLPARGPDELHAALGDLGAAPTVLPAGPEDRLVIVQPLGQRHRAELGGRHPGDGRGGVGPHDHDLAAAVDELEHLLLGHGRARLEQQVIKFQLRRHDLRVAPPGKQLRQPPLDLPALPALGKQPVPGPLRRVDTPIHRESPLYALSLYHANILYCRALVKVSPLKSCGRKNRPHD